MKIGIITFHRAINYGACLQAFATKIVLKKMGHEAEIIDCNNIGEHSWFYWNTSSLRSFIGAVLISLLGFLFDRRRLKMFKRFGNQYLGLTSDVYTPITSKHQVEKYDYVIVGSDQVWHPQINEGMTEFYLDIPVDNHKKIAYGASFGVDNYTDEEVKMYFPLINNIQSISCREKIGVEMIKKHLGKDVELVLDPTLLLSREDWNEYVIKPKKQNYLFYFTILNQPEGLDELVKRIAQERNLSIVRIGSNRDVLNRDYTDVRNSNPLEFLGWIAGADFVVNTSFHGSVFSSIFQKEFICVKNDNNRNSRMETLFDHLGIQKRLIDDISDFDMKLLNQKIDYQMVDANIAKMRESSIEFLTKAIK